jgi:A/G-specific adenine glycosylase
MRENDFISLVWKFYAEHGRHELPWRNTEDPYAILVSEIMLQQTQVDRVIPKYHSFLKRFETVTTLANASQETLLREWKGLGYNRRALNLKRAAKIITKDFDTIVPKDTRALTSLPGIGPYTAAAVQAFAFNQPSLVIETNIRTAFIKHFFSAESTEKIPDEELFPLIEKTLDRKRPREWYSALMDYGAHIKKNEGNLSRRSKGYIRQSPFKGSNRENRSHILELLLEKSRTNEEIISALKDSRTKKNIKALLKEGFITSQNNHLEIEK